MASSMWSQFSSKVKDFDAYPKTLEDFRIKTISGATVTLISGTIMLLLFLSELKYYLTTEVNSELFVDMSRGNKLSINMNVTFPLVPCEFLSLDMIDVSGQRDIDVQHTLVKQPLNSDGSWVAEAAEKVDLVGTKPVLNATEPPPADYCGSCFGAETKDMTCCNTCSDIKEAYRRKGWAFPRDGSITPCIGEDDDKEPVGSGCYLHGHLEVNRVAGNFHISPGKSYEVGHMHVHDMARMGKYKESNVSHVFNHLSFGSTYPGQVHPLDNLEVIASESSVAFQYYVKIVPTTYEKLSGDTFHTNQFSVTRHQKRNKDSRESLPGMFVSYELSPMMVRYVERRRSFVHFLTSVCAIIGGIFTVAGLFDSFIYHGSKALQKKIELGKAF
uniref:Endoplasmic reticulum-Golgi intermediate compartment protein 3 n=1 Tax=Ciona intestinalis TaxID=7719 RepID=F6YGL5_CIOIN|nr:endoplasmic reticulum-Golgi intermediate compartment protein 3-like [Ciona intestinalis]|eukprot:XP_009860519.1 endoplasmic reticulum-Golgi intermediate compartment protein 3-like [Ciona intestinalis]